MQIRNADFVMSMLESNLNMFCSVVIITVIVAVLVILCTLQYYLKRTFILEVSSS